MFKRNNITRGKTDGQQELGKAREKRRVRLVSFINKERGIERGGRKKEGASMCVKRRVARSMDKKSRIRQDNNTSRETERPGK